MWNIRLNQENHLKSLEKSRPVFCMQGKRIQKGNKGPEVSVFTVRYWPLQRSVPDRYWHQHGREAASRLLPIVRGDAKKGFEDFAQWNDEMKVEPNSRRGQSSVRKSWENVSLSVRMEAAASATRASLNLQTGRGFPSMCQSPPSSTDTRVAVKVVETIEKSQASLIVSRGKLGHFFCLQSFLRGFLIL